MGKVDELKKDVELAKKELKRVKSELLAPAEKMLERCMQRLVEEVCFCNVGDKLTNGKDFIFVSRIEPLALWNKRISYRLHGHKIKKNGAPYKNESYICRAGTHIKTQWHVAESKGGKQ